jgi:hypothetical protein
MIWILLGIMALSLATVAVLFWLAPQWEEPPELHKHDPANYR